MLPAHSFRSATVGVAMLVGLALVAAPAVGAAGPHVTKGAAMAILQARTTANAIQAENGKVMSAPRAGFASGRIWPFPGPVRTYCASDWHVVMVTFLAEGGRAEAGRTLAGLDATFFLDGRELSTIRTAVKAFLPRPKVQRSFGITIGRLMAPSDIAVGEHHLRTVIKDAVHGRSELDVTFLIVDEHTDSDEVSCKGH